MYKDSRFQHFITSLSFKRYEVEYLKKITKLGFPSALQMFFEVGFFRTFIGALILLLAVLFRSGNLELFQKNSFTYAIIGLFNAAIPFTLIPYGLMSLPSNIGVIIMSANPFLALVLAHYFTEDEKLNLRKTTITLFVFCSRTNTEEKFILYTNNL
mgnify:CR=1 FL=1